MVLVLEKYDTLQVLCAMASSLDSSVGELEQLLRGAEMWDDTLLWALSDNGGMVHWQDDFPASASSNWVSELRAPAPPATANRGVASQLPRTP